MRKFGPRVYESILNTKKHFALGTVWETLSSNGKNVYQTEMVEKGFTCDCPAFKKCKHIVNIEEGFLCEV